MSVTSRSRKFRSKHIPFNLISLKINTKISFVQILKTIVTLSFVKLILSGGQNILNLKLFYFQSFSLGNICDMLSDNDCKADAVVLLHLSLET
jgi:hypothetical protein